MEQLTLNQSAETYIENYIISPPPHDSSFDALDKAYKAGAEWQKEQYNGLLQALKTIATWPGNLPDHCLNTATGPNDARYRGEMVVSMRSLAIEAIRKHDPEYVPFS